MTKKYVPLVLISLLLTACGGGGGDDTTSTATAPVNQPPILTLSATSLTMEENTEAVVNVTVTDSDSSSVSVEVSSALLQVRFDTATSQITANAPEVDANTETSITVQAKDSDGNTVTRTITVSITDKPTAPPEVSWVGFDAEPSFQVKERTRLRLPFSVIDPDSESFEYAVEFTSLSGDRYADFEFDTKIDRSANELVVIPKSAPITSRVEFRGTLTVSDGRNTDTATFLVSVAPNKIDLNISLTSFLIVAGETKTIPFTIRANDLDAFEFTKLEYVDEDDVTTDPLTFAIDKASQTLTVSAKAGTAGKTVKLRISFEEIEGWEYGRIINITIRDQITQNEMQLQKRLDRFIKLIELSNDYEYVTRYALDILFARGALTAAEYESNLVKNYQIRAVNLAFARAVYDNTIESLQNSQLYVDDAEYQSIIERIDYWTDNLYRFRGENVAFINPLLDKLGYANLGSEAFIYLDDDRISRFVGNTFYGSYQDGRWVFSAEYQYLAAPLGLLLNEEF
ncbi:Ig-like domain-containing protein [Rheinheimera sp. UJ63]|uniref:Ig-like domain-containing protein n=1 Tax=Rheinheimera sp. UJ63 TaxID=2910157 RepID=UPI001F2AD528|nr:hypothetical protein [Rheinheimera sp. UJ63]MCF4010860.1 hypothetical protein [Rheinheimera sp. UJ63]